jgi:hypothetical protein
VRRRGCVLQVARGCKFIKSTVFRVIKVKLSEYDVYIDEILVARAAACVELGWCFEDGYVCWASGVALYSRVYTI